VWSFLPAQTTEKHDSNFIFAQVSGFQISQSHHRFFGAVMIRIQLVLFMVEPGEKTSVPLSKSWSFFVSCWHPHTNDFNQPTWKLRKDASKVPVQTAGQEGVASMVPVASVPIVLRQSRLAWSTLLMPCGFLAAHLPFPVSFALVRHLKTNNNHKGLVVVGKLL
jgi:hypothetical protein